LAKVLSFKKFLRSFKVVFGGGGSSVQKMPDTELHPVHRSPCHNVLYKL